MNIKERIAKVFVDVFDEEIEIFDEMTADDIDDWDSLTHIQLIVGVEKEFGIKFTTPEVLSLKNVGQFIHLVEEKVSSVTEE